MRGRLFLGLLSCLLATAANPALADNESPGNKESAGQPSVATPGSASITNVLAPATTGSTVSTGSAAATVAPEVKDPAQPNSSPDVPVAPVATENSSAQEAAALEPHKRPVPEGYAAAAELFKQRKFALAQKEFEKIIQSGAADVNTHLCLAHCFLQQKLYTKATKEFDWLSKYAKNSMSLQKSCEHTARSLRAAMSGQCPANCIKPSDPRWTTKAGARVLQFPHTGGGYDTFTPANIGQLVVFEHGNAVVKGTCPVCEGTTQIPVLKDGGPMPRI